jgi:iron(III) transport system permease protein
LTFNTVTVSSFSALLIVLIALFFLYVEKFSKNKINYFISQSISLGYAIPGAVVGLALIMLVTSINDMFSSFTLLGSFYLLVYAYIIRFLAVGKSPIKSSLEKQPDSYDDTAKNLGLGPLKLLQKIHLPINKFALITAFIVTFIDLMKELPITLILRPFNFDTLATQTYEFAVEEMIPLSSVYSLMIILIGSILLMFLKNVINKQINVS